MNVEISRALIVVAGALWAAASAFACGVSEVDPLADAAPGPIIGPPSDGGVDALAIVDGGGGDVDVYEAGLDAALDAGEAGPPIWLLANYCGTGTDNACPAAACPDIDGGIAAHGCTTAHARCREGSADAAVAARIFSCQPTGESTWNLIALCGAFVGTDCTPDGGPAACAAQDGGVFGRECATPDARCRTGERIVECQPGDARTWMLAGYCSLPSTPTCASLALDDCPDVDGGVVGAACPTPLARCVRGKRTFVCAER